MNTKAKRTFEPLLPHPNKPAFESAIMEMIERRQGAYRVLAHSGRGRGEKWRCLYESASREDAEAFFWRRVTTVPKSGLDRKATRLECVGYGTIHSVNFAGEDDGCGFRVDCGTEIAASEARWLREQREAARNRVRVAPMVRVRVAVPPPAVENAFDEQAEHEAAEAEAEPSRLRVRI